jgi:D-alanyl-lipoteichoic acid acyltransferase DltB (MBOAT superfamily)
MALGGLWHGAGWTFVVWGVLHGLALALGVLWRRVNLPMPAILGWFLTFGFVTLAWVFFRAPTFKAAERMFEALFLHSEWGSGTHWRTITIAAVIALTAPPTGAIVSRLAVNSWTAVGAAIALAAVLLEVGGDHVVEFIYFQF